MQAVREETEVFMESLEADKRAAADHFWECQRADEMRRSAPSLCGAVLRLYTPRRECFAALAALRLCAARASSLHCCF